MAEKKEAKETEIMAGEKAEAAKAERPKTVKPKAEKTKAAAKAPAKKAAEKAGEERKYAIRGNIFTGIVVSAKAHKTVTVERELTHYIRKYERYRKIKSRVKAHNPASIGAKEGDRVKVGETRKTSKSKSFVVINILGDKK